MTEITEKEWKFVGILSLLVIVITTLPTVVGFFLTPKDSIFLGTQIVNSRDTPVYYSWIEQVREGHFLFRNLYTPEAKEEPRFIFDPFWLGVGLLAKFFGLSPVVSYQLVRILIIPIFLILAYIFISLFLRDINKREICFIFLIFASGIGGFVVLGEGLGLYKFPPPPPLDLVSAETTTFYALFHSPHFLASLLFTILIFTLIFVAFEKQKIIYSFFAGLAALFFFQFHPFFLPTIYGVIGMYILVQSLRDLKIRWDLIKHFLILVLVSSPAVLYHFWTLKNFWTRQQHALQVIIPTPPFYYNYIVTYGFLWIFSLVGIFSLFRKKEKSNQDIFLITWWGTQIFLPYLPFINFQRRLMEGLHVAVVITAIIGLFYLKEIFKNNSFYKKWLSSKFVLVLLFVLMFTFSNQAIILLNLNFYMSQSPVAYLDKIKVESMLWLRENTKEEDIIFSSHANGNLIPAFALRLVYLGHEWGQTADAKNKIEQTNLFFTKFNDKERASFLKINEINYVFYGPEERRFQNFNPEAVDYLEKVYQNEKVAIYKVKF